MECLRKLRFCRLSTDCRPCDGQYVHRGSTEMSIECRWLVLVNTRPRVPVVHKIHFKVGDPKCCNKKATETKTFCETLQQLFFADTHLQWTIMGPAPSWLAAADFRMKSNAGYSQPTSGAPWSGQPVKWYCNTSIGFTSSSVASWTQTFNNYYVIYYVPAW